MAKFQILYHSEVVRRDIPSLDPPVRQRIKAAIEQRLTTHPEHGAVRGAKPNLHERPAGYGTHPPENLSHRKPFYRRFATKGRRVHLRPDRAPPMFKGHMACETFYKALESRRRRFPVTTMPSYCRRGRAFGPIF